MNSTARKVSKTLLTALILILVLASVAGSKNSPVNFKFFVSISNKLNFLVGVYGAFVRLPGPIWRRNPFIGIWLSCVLLFFSMQTFYVLMKKPYEKQTYLAMQVVYFVITTLAGFTLTVCYGLVARLDSAVLSGCITLVNAASVVILVTSRTRNLNSMYIVATTEHLNSSINVTESKTSSSQLESNKSSARCCKYFLKGINVALKVVFLILIGFLAAGSVIMGAGTLR